MIIYIDFVHFREVTDVLVLNCLSFPFCSIIMSTFNLLIILASYD